MLGQPSRMASSSTRAGERVETSDLLQSLSDALQADTALVELLQKTIKAEPSSVLREGSVIADGFDPELDELRGIQTNCGDFLLELEMRERARTGISTLKVGIQPRARFLHRGQLRQRFQGAGRLPPPPDAKERRAPTSRRN